MFAQGWTAHDLAQPWGAESDSVEAIRGFGETVQYAEADCADPDAPRAVVTAARAAFGPVDVLVVNHARSGQRARLGSTRLGLTEL